MVHWTNPQLTDRDGSQEAPFLFPFKGSYWLMVDSGGIRTYKSPNGIDQWEYNTTVMRANDGGTRPMDDPVGHHEGIVLQTAPDGTEQCLIFYFTQRGNLTWIHVTELELGADGKVFVNRNKYPAATQPAK